MAHNLNEVEGKVAFASNKKAWHNLGQIVDSPMTTKEAIQLGGLDYDVEKIPLFTADGTQLAKTMATQRKDTKAIFGTVGEKYEIVQNRDAFDFFDTLLGEGHAKIETVGALGEGERIFVSAKLPHSICVGKDDLTEMYCLLTSSHDGSGAIVAGLTPVRVVCQNTLNMALSRQMKNRISVRHTSNAQKRLGQAGEIMRQSLSYQQTLKEAYNFLYRTKVEDKVTRSLIKDIIQQDKKDSTRVTNIIDQIETCYNVGVGQDAILGTAWGVFNAVTHYVSHEKNYMSDESKFNSLLLNGESEKVIKRSFDILMDYAKVG